MHDGRDAPACNDAAATTLAELEAEMSALPNDGASTAASRSSPQFGNKITDARSADSTDQCIDVRPRVLIHRCEASWWESAKRSSAVWATWGRHVPTDVTARQVLAVEVALRASLAAVILRAAYSKLQAL
eukprot:SAG31_NODE_396_length_16264_cov_17.206496_8_plen_130_part_00